MNERTSAYRFPDAARRRLTVAEQYAAALNQLRSAEPNLVFSQQREVGDLKIRRQLNEQCFLVETPDHLTAQTEATESRLVLFKTLAALKKAAMDQTFRTRGYAGYLADVCELVAVPGRPGLLGLLTEDEGWSYLRGDEFSPLGAQTDTLDESLYLKALNQRVMEEAAILYRRLGQDGISLGVEHIKVGARVIPAVNLWDKRIFIDVLGSDVSEIDLDTHHRDTTRQLPSIAPVGSYWDLIEAAAPS